MVDTLSHKQIEICINLYRLKLNGYDTISSITRQLNIYSSDSKVHELFQILKEKDIITIKSVIGPNKLIKINKKKLYYYAIKQKKMSNYIDFVKEKHLTVKW